MAYLGCIVFVLEPACVARESNAHFLDSSLRLRCVAVGRFGPGPGFVTLRQTFVHCCQCGIVRKQGEPTGRMALLDGRDEQ